MKKRKSLKDVRSKRHDKPEVPVVELVSIHDGKVVVRVCGQEQEVEYGHFVDLSKMDQEEIRKKVELMEYINEHPEHIGIYYVALKYCHAFGIEFRESVNSISWEYDEGRKTVTIYRKPWYADNGCVYFGEICSKEAPSRSRRFIDTGGAKAFIDEATKAMEELERTGGTRDAHESER